MTSHPELNTHLVDISNIPAPASLIEAVTQSETYSRAGNTIMAIAVYQRFIQTAPRDQTFIALFNLAALLSASQRKIEAEACYRQAIAINPQFFHAHINLGLSLDSSLGSAAAIEHWESVLSQPYIHNPEHSELKIELLNQLGRTCEVLREYEKSEKYLTESLQIKPEQPTVILHWFHLRQKQCKWPAWHGTEIALDYLMRNISAMAQMAFADKPADQLACAKNYVQDKVGLFHRMVPYGHQYGHNKIRIGFASSDLSTHAVSLLTVELFETLNREQFEVHAFCWSKEDGTHFRERVKKAFDKFHKVGHLNDEEIAKLIKAQEIDVLFDLQGLTAGARPNVIAYGAAPYQVGYLGFPGPSALPYLDFVVADPFIFPTELAPHFSEKPLYVKTLFQVSDSKRPIAPTPTRTQFGLPEDQFVYCAFNNAYKFTPELFTSWLEILREVPHSVLWLLDDNIWAKENLTRAILAHGIDPARVHFAGRIQPADYLARFSAADLFLDTHPYNAGTTASDALWAGLPILTWAGKSYVSRMAGSLLTSVGLSELITYSRSEYVSKAIELASQPQKIIQFKAQLQAEKASGRMFNTARFCDELFDALQPLFHLKECVI